MNKAGYMYVSSFGLYHQHLLCHSLVHQNILQQGYNRLMWVAKYILQKAALQIFIFKL